jgi:CRP-like cAMP-binding protein
MAMGSLAPAPLAHPNRLLSALSESERSRLQNFLEPVDLAFRQVLVKSEAPVTHAVFLLDAVSSTVAELPDGNVVEVAVTGREGFVGHELLCGSLAPATSVIVQIPGRGLRMRAADFRREIVERDGEAFRLLLRYTGAFTEMVAQVAGCNASHSVEQRFARWLLLVHDRVGRNGFPVTHELAALLLGVRRAGVTEAANRLRIAGAIDYRAGDMRILDRARLEAVACGCYDAMARIVEMPFVNS